MQRIETEALLTTIQDMLPSDILMPRHIAIIMDGNGRWAQKRGLPRNEGHLQGCRTIQNLVEECDRMGLRYLTVYAFSTENWSRPKREVRKLMHLLRLFLLDTENKLESSNVRIRVIGSRKGLDKSIVDSILRTEAKSQEKKGMQFIIALNYGGREELTHAVQTIVKKVRDGEIREEEIGQETIAEHLYTAGIPDPDLIIRPSGELRLSNFLLWQSSYAELWFSDVLWPDFTIQHLLQALEDYGKRNRRFGGI